MHLIIPYASAPSAACRAAMPGLRLPSLEQLLACLSPQGREAGDEYSFTPPHERELARALAIYQGDGLVPWAAWELRRDGQDPGEHAWATLTPCHWQVGANEITMHHPQTLQLQAQESQALLEAMQAYFAEDGIELSYQAPLRWLARSPLWQDLPTASLDRVLGRNVIQWMPDAPQAAKLRRLHSEMQMLLDRHPVNDARSERGLAPVNAFWVSGTGRLPAAAASESPQLVDALREAAMNDDAAAWSAAWTELDASQLAPLLASARSGQPVRLTLCGERTAVTYTSPVRPVWQRLGQMLRRPWALSALEPL